MSDQPTETALPAPEGPWDGLTWWGDNFHVELTGYAWDNTVSLQVWQDGDELAMDVGLDAPALRRLAAWALSVAEAIENPPSINEMPAYPRATRMPPTPTLP